MSAPDQLRRAVADAHARVRAVGKVFAEARGSRVRSSVPSTFKRRTTHLPVAAPRRESSPSVDEKHTQSGCDSVLRLARPPPTSGRSLTVLSCGAGAGVALANRHTHGARVLVEDGHRRAAAAARPGRSRARRGRRSRPRRSAAPRPSSRGRRSARSIPRGRAQALSTRSLTRSTTAGCEPVGVPPRQSSSRDRVASPRKPYRDGHSAILVGGH